MVQVSATAPGVFQQNQAHWPCQDPWWTCWWQEHVSWGLEAGPATAWLMTLKE